MILLLDFFPLILMDAFACIDIFHVLASYFPHWFGPYVDQSDAVVYVSYFLLIY